MTALPIILVAGGAGLHIQLAEALPPQTCSIIHSGNSTEATTRAAEASLVLVDSSLPGGGIELCRRLRSNSLTNHIPIILLIENEQDHVQAITNARVLISDFPAILRSLRRLCPNIEVNNSNRLHRVSAETRGIYLFDDGAATSHWRRPMVDPDAASNWPPPPPEIISNIDLFEFAKEYAGYMNSLLEAMEALHQLSPSELERLDQSSKQIIEATDQVLNTLQQAIHEALIDKRLERMKGLSAAKNSIYEKLQKLRPLFKQVKKTRAKRATAEGQEERVILAAIPELASGNKANSPKSELTRAAEALASKRANERTATQQQSTGQIKKKLKLFKIPGLFSHRGNARKAPSSNWSDTFSFWRIVIVLLVILGALALYSRRGERNAPPPPINKHQPPQMVYVVIEQTLGGIIARPQAKTEVRIPISFTIRWFVNGTEIRDERTARLPMNKYRLGDIIQAEVTPVNQYNAGKPMSSNQLKTVNLSQSIKKTNRPTVDAQ